MTRDGAAPRSRTIRIAIRRPFLLFGTAEEALDLVPEGTAENEGHGNGRERALQQHAPRAGIDIREARDRTQREKRGDNRQKAETLVLIIQSGPVLSSSEERAVPDPVRLREPPR